MTLALSLSSIDSPIGPLALAVDDEGAVRGASFGPGLAAVMRREYPDADLREGEAPASLCEALAAYFAGRRDVLDAIPWAVQGDGFQPRVWRELARVPAGTTITYGEMARRAGEPGAAQAAGVALNRNPIPLILACHRVIGADGALVGFGGGVERKRWLLAHEGALLL